MVERGYGATKAALVLDHGGDYNITYAQKGILILKVTARSHGGHSSAPWAFRNPVDMLTDAYQKLRKEWGNPVSEEDWRNSMAPCVIAGGDAENRIPDTAEMVLNFRYVADEDYQKIIDLVTATGLEVSVLRTCPPVSNDINAPALQLLQQAFQSVLAHPVRFIRMCGATESAQHSGCDYRHRGNRSAFRGGEAQAGINRYLPENIEGIFDTFTVGLSLNIPLRSLRGRQ